MSAALLRFISLKVKVAIFRKTMSKPPCLALLAFPSIEVATPSDALFASFQCPSRRSVALLKVAIPKETGQAAALLPSHPCTPSPAPRIKHRRRAKPQSPHRRLGSPTRPARPRVPTRLGSAAVQRRGPVASADPARPVGRGVSQYRPSLPRPTPTPLCVPLMRHGRRGARARQSGLVRGHGCAAPKPNSLARPPMRMPPPPLPDTAELLNSIRMLRHTWHAKNERAR